MNEMELSKYLGHFEWSIVDAMKHIDKNSVGLIYVVDDHRRLKGCITDGDIRRWVIRTGDILGKVSDAMNHSPQFLYDKDRDLAIKKMEKEHIYSVAVLNKDNILVDIIFHDVILDLKVKQIGKGLLGTPVIIMAGGKGKRLYPYTKILPKPLIPIGDVPILERIFERFYGFGVNDFYLTVNYRKEMIKSYFSELELKYTIHYIEEDSPLGTAGSISLIEDSFDRTVIVANCDVLIEEDYEKILKHHLSIGNAMTIVSSLKNMSIPYGVLHSKEHGIVTSMEEKPELSYFINTGMYILEPKYLSWIPKGKVYHMTDLAKEMMEKGEQIGMFPISENSFLDMGQFEEMKKMEERLGVRL